MFYSVLHILIFFKDTIRKKVNNNHQLSSRQ